MALATCCSSRVYCSKICIWKIIIVIHLALKFIFCLLFILFFSNCWAHIASFGSGNYAAFCFCTELKQKLGVKREPNRSAPERKASGDLCFAVKFWRFARYFLSFLLLFLFRFCVVRWRLTDCRTVYLVCLDCCYCCLWGLRKFVQHALGVSHNSALSTCCCCSASASSSSSSSSSCYMAYSYCPCCCYWLLAAFWCWNHL